MKRYIFHLPGGLLFFFALVMSACSKPGAEESFQQYVVKDSVRRMEDFIPVLPEAEGLNELKASCNTCHSLQYIAMQPDFPPKAWEALVTKMQKTFGAPMSDSTAAKIIHYLVAIKGKQ